MEALGINLGYFFVQLFNFLVLFVILKAWVYGPIIKMLEDRREKIAQGMEDARVAAEARANAETEAEKIVADAQSEAAQVVREASQRAEEVARDIKAAAEKFAGEAANEARAGVAEERDALLGEVRGQIAVLAMSATQKLLGENLDEKRQHALIDEFFSGVKDGKVVIADGAEGDAVVTSALPLTDGEKKSVEGTVKGSIEFKVDPTILGGLVIRVGDKVLDGSVASKLDTMRQNVK
ncbi:MAG: F0F1 ATP synthase subunit B [Chloroflexi bacterium]|nr:F0F1 ATP synthase subunit B [Chloroflexota bacterium]MBT3671286.1 F0F1 ATP synthase subunit B [Chloroflexota bacterium]MBT4001771.1 F0F1 ATP synthase subunit B [Chloroflexota bacterium]MBT4304255.1 F0F1 ATP synthase subunit B [Chloroflexota bacterium]MBT4534274.1 F0F1 ATP synthase subunit B [Chloroflexota bacterium]